MPLDSAMTDEIALGETWSKKYDLRKVMLDVSGGSFTDRRDWPTFYEDYTLTRSSYSKIGAIPV
jgi:hypothetical protein